MCEEQTSLFSMCATSSSKVVYSAISKKYMELSAVETSAFPVVTVVSASSTSYCLVVETGFEFGDSVNGVSDHTFVRPDCSLAKHAVYE